MKYDGLSGNHVLFFQALDAFLGMERYLTDENMERYIPVRQRELCLVLKKYSFVRGTKEKEETQIEEEFAKMVNQLKVYIFLVYYQFPLSPFSLWEFRADVSSLVISSSSSRTRNVLSPRASSRTSSNDSWQIRS